MITKSEAIDHAKSVERLLAELDRQRKIATINGDGPVVIVGEVWPSIRRSLLVLIEAVQQ